MNGARLPGDGRCFHGSFLADLDIGTVPHRAHGGEDSRQPGGHQRTERDQCRRCSAPCCHRIRALHAVVAVVFSQGICESLTYEEIQERFPQEFAWRDQDKLKYRYPHGESYLDLLQRVDSVVLALLTSSDVLVVSHQAVLRCVMAYFKGTKPGKQSEMERERG